MSFNGSGTFQINSAGQPVVAGTVITAAAFNALTADLATGLSTCITKDGQTSATANIPMGNNKFTGLSAGTSATDSTNLGQVQGNVASLISVAGIDTITGSMSPTLTAYSTGAMYWFVAAGTNTGAVTLNIDGLGAKSVTRDGSTALIAGDIVNGQVAVVVYDGTRFQLQKANAFGTLTATTINTTNLTATGTVNLTGATVSNGGSVTTIDINGGTVDGVTIGGASAGAATFTNLTASGTINFTGATVSNLGSVTTADINGGTVDGVTIGGASAGAGTFTNLTASGTINFTGATVSNGGSVTTVDINGGTIDGAIIGGTSAAAGTFTTATVGAGLVVTPSLTTTGDTNTGLYFPAADTIAATTGGSERMRITSSGDVGIGTTGPSGRLDVRGSNSSTFAFFSGTTKGVRFSIDSTGTYLEGVDNTGYSSYQPLGLNGSFLQFATGATERMRIDSSGKVGIGTSSPNSNALLTNNGNIAIAAPTRNQATSNQVGVWTSDDPVSNDRAAITIATVAGGSSSSSYISFTTNNYGVSRAERMRIDSSGNVGIGTTPTASTASKLFIDGDITRINAAGGFLFNIYYDTAQARWEYAGTGTGAGWIDSGSGNYTFQSTGSTSGTAGAAATALAERMRIDSSGNVRIGTAALATTATDGFLYVPTCAGTPTGTPTAITGLAPIVINTTNNKLYFYSGGAWRDAGP